MAITSFTPGFQIGTMNTTPTIDFTKGLSLGASNKVSLSNPLGDLNIKPKTGQNLLGNINMGQLAAMALPMVTGALGKINDYTKRNITDQQKTEFDAIYGRGENPIFDLFSLGKDARNTAQQIKNTAYINTGVLGSNQDILNAYNSLDFNSWKPNNNKINFWQANLKNLEASAKGASAGSSFGPWGALIGGIAGGVADIGSYIGSGKRRQLINNAKEIAKNKSLDSFTEQVYNTQKQNNLNSLKSLYALGGTLDYDLQNQYAINNYMNTLNKSKITSMPNSFYKPQFESMNYFATGGSPDFNEFNTGGTHEQNRNGGIPQGFDNQGILNLVEQGEVKIKTKEGQDYILQDRQSLPEEWCKDHKVPIGSTPAEAARYLRKEYDENPNDPILKRMWEEVNVPDLIEINEIMKQEAALKEARKQGLNSPKMQGIESQVMQDMYYNENPQEEISLQQGINPNIQNAFGGNIRRFDGGGNLYDYAQIGLQLPSIIKGLQKPDYSYANEVLNSIGKEQRLNIPNSYTYYTYNPVDELQYLNKQQAQDAALINTLQNTSNPSRNSSILAAAAQNAANRSKLINDIANINYTRKTENTKLNNAITDQVNSNLIAQATHNLQLDNLDYNKMIQGLKLKQDADNIIGENLSSGLSGISKMLDARRQEENSLGIAALSAIAQGVPFTDGVINALYNINPKLGDIGFSTREDFSSYKNRAQRNAILQALKDNNYNIDVYGNLDRYVKDQAVINFILDKYNYDNSWNGESLGLSYDNFKKIIGG